MRTTLSRTILAATLVCAVAAPAGAAPSPTPSPAPATGAQPGASGRAAAPVGASALSPLAAARLRPALRYRSRGPAVVYVQQRLGVSPTSGYFGSLTRRALRSLQRTRGLTVTGRTDAATWTVLLSGDPLVTQPTPAPPTATPPPPAVPTPTPEQAAATRPTLRYGRGPGDPAVVYVQRFLNVVPDSGYFGKLTRRAVRAYQKGLGIRATGVVGSRTWAAILAGKHPGAPSDQPPAAAPAPTPAPAPTGGSAAARRAVAFAMAQVGERYVLGGNGPDVWDCSGLVQQAYLGVGVRLPRRASQQRFAGRKVTLADLAPGDLLYYQDGSSPRRGHISMYAGNGLAVEAANPRRGVRVRPLGESWYAKRFVVAVRVA